jgi:hypothetical protein
MIIVHLGSDAPGWYIGPDGQIHYFEGWGIESLREVQLAIQAIEVVSRLRTPRLADGITKTLAGFVNKELGSHIGANAGDAGVVVLA